ncbi:MAG: hypothetical protein GY847_14195 [Proteobacteria bacterium]|nr:hypothetical protein [Pseudomonadota bacterium]
MQNSKFLERCNIDLVMEPVDTNDGATTGDYVSFQNYRRCAIVLAMGDGTAASDIDMTVYQATDNSGTGAKALTVLETGRIYRKSAATYAAYAAVTAWTEVSQSTAATDYTPDDNGEEVGLQVLELDASDLDTTNGFDHIRCDLTDPGAAKICSAFYIMFDPVYSHDPALMLDPKTQ